MSRGLASIRVNARARTAGGPISAATPCRHNPRRGARTSLPRRKVHNSARDRTRPGLRRASSWATTPPIECPTTWTRSQSSASRSCTASAARDWIDTRSIGTGAVAYPAVVIPRALVMGEDCAKLGRPSAPGDAEPLDEENALPRPARGRCHEARTEWRGDWRGAAVLCVQVGTIRLPGQQPFSLTVRF